VNGLLFECLNRNFCEECKDFLIEEYNEEYEGQLWEESMRIINLIENTEGISGCVNEHGLSFFIETEKHKALLDLGQTNNSIKNAEILGVDLKAVDTVVLSHGHYDHSGGIMTFAGINDQAIIYMQRSAGGEYYADDGKLAVGDRYRYIGIDKEILKLPQVRLIQGDHVIDDELEVFTISKRTHMLPFTNKRLLIKTEDGFIPDDFTHEHFLVVKNNGRTVLMSGCAHNGILSILDAYKEKYRGLPDVVISGFHLMIKREYRENELQEVRGIAEELSKYPTKFYTCHCTGVPAFEEMKKIMGDQLEYVHSGEEIII
jgi:7,8-dihydropterin-6-yl-methyl-4-(beta-D-ribofuranosyl)aminobenzene 5'-phosphate synthase